MVGNAWILYFLVHITELPKNAKCMMDCEAAQILQGIQEQMVLLSQDPTIKLPLWVTHLKLLFSSRRILKHCSAVIVVFIFRSYDRGLQFAKTGAHYTNPQSVRRVLEYPWFCYFQKHLCMNTCYSKALMQLCGSSFAVPSIVELLTQYQDSHKTWCLWWRGIKFNLS